MSIIRLVNCEFFARHGVFPEEQKVGTKYGVDVELSVDIEVAADQDDLSKTADYGVVYGIVKRIITEQQVKLIETLAKQIAVESLDKIPIVTTVKVTIRKHHPPIGGLCDFAEIEYSLQRKSE